MTRIPASIRLPGRPYEHFWAAAADDISNPRDSGAEEAAAFDILVVCLEGCNEVATYTVEDVRDAGIFLWRRTGIFPWGTDNCVWEAISC
jgi:hypothetical protein